MCLVSFDETKLKDMLAWHNTVLMTLLQKNKNTLQKHVLYVVSTTAAVGEAGAATSAATARLSSSTSQSSSSFGSE